MRPFCRAALAALTLLSAAPESAGAHGWYPRDCCNDHDCAEITSLTQLPNGLLRVETEQGFAVAPRGFSPKPSPDNQAHACLRQIGPDEEHMGWMLICLFLPGIS